MSDAWEPFRGCARNIDGNVNTDPRKDLAAVGSEIVSGAALECPQSLRVKQRWARPVGTSHGGLSLPASLNEYMGAMEKRSKPTLMVDVHE